MKPSEIRELFISNDYEAVIIRLPNEVIRPFRAQLRNGRCNDLVTMAGADQWLSQLDLVCVNKDEDIRYFRKQAQKTK